MHLLYDFRLNVKYLLIFMSIFHILAGVTFSVLLKLLKVCSLTAEARYDSEKWAIFICQHNAFVLYFKFTKL